MRVALVTGGTSGIGAATAQALKAAGYRVAANYGSHTEAALRFARQADIPVFAWNVADPAACREGVARVEAELGGVDVLVNNAGVMLLGAVVADQRAEQRRQVEVNLLGAMTATEVFLDQLREGGGDLVNISSVAGRVAGPGGAAYHATKWGLTGWSEALRQELQPDIRVIVVEPGAVATELTDHITHGATKQATRDYVRDLAITSEDIAEVIAFAVSRPKRMTLNEILVRPTAQER